MRKLIIIWALLISVCYAQSKPGFYVVGGKVITVQDTSSRNYLKAIENAGVVPSVLQNAASNFLVTSEKAIGSYSLITAQYPFIGGNAATHKFNLNNPIDTDAGFRLTYNGTITHSSQGVQNATAVGSNFINTFLNPFIVLSANNTHLSIYSTSEESIYNGFNNSFPSEIGASTGTNTNNFRLSVKWQDGRKVFEYGNDNSLLPTTSSGKYTLGTNASSLSRLYKDGVQIASSSVMNSSLPNFNIKITQDGRADNALPSSRIIGYASIGAGFTDTQAIQQSRIVTFFNSMQNR